MTRAYYVSILQMIQGAKYDECIRRPAVSICLPVYNGEKFLKAAIESVLNQTFIDFELLISNDCSSDNSEEIIKHFAKQDSRIIHWSNERNYGLFANYNKCLSKALGKFIKPFAQDDLLHPRMLAACTEALCSDSNIALVSTNRKIIDDLDREVELEIAAIVKKCAQGLHFTLTAEQLLEATLFPMVNFVGEPSTVMFRANSISTGFNETLHHLGDIEYWLRIVNNDGIFLFINDSLCSFRTHLNSASSRNMMGLHTAIDIIRMGRVFKDCFGKLGKTEKDYIQSNLKSFATRVAHDSSLGRISTGLMDELNASMEKQIQEELNRGDSQIYAMNAFADLADMRELCFHLSSMLAPIKREHNRPTKIANVDIDLRIRANASLIEKREQKLRRMMNSKSWRLTKVLRDLSKLVSARTAIQNSRSAPVFSVKNFDVSTRQETYLKFLRHEIRELRSSNSWSITKPLRSISMPYR